MREASGFFMGLQIVTDDTMPRNEIRLEHPARKCPNCGLKSVLFGPKHPFPFGLCMACGWCDGCGHNVLWPKAGAK